MANILTKQIMDHIVQKCAKGLADAAPASRQTEAGASGTHLTERHAALLSDLLNKKGQGAERTPDRGVKGSLPEIKAQAKSGVQVKTEANTGPRGASAVHGRAVSLDELLGRLK